MTFRIAATVLGKRGVTELYAAPSLAFQHATKQLARPLQTARHFHFSPCRCQQQSDKIDSTSQKLDQTTSAASKSSSSSSSSFERTAQPDFGDWEDNPDLSISKFSELPGKHFGINQHIVINEEFKEALRQILWQFRAPIRYAFAYGSGVFPQSAKSTTGTSLHPNPPEAISKVQGGNQKMIDFIFGVSFSQHWHSLNLQEHKDHYSSLGYLGSYAVSKIQDSLGAGVYFNPYVTINGTLIKYGVVNIDTL